MSSVGSITTVQPLARACAWAASLNLAQIAGEAAGIFVLCPVLLAIACWNGFPLIFYDTGAYLLEGLGHVFVPERAPVYSLFLGYAGAAKSLWFVALIQALLTAIVLVETARAESPDMRIWELAGIGMTLLAVTGIGWYVGQIEPDCMTALVVLSLYLLSFRSERLGTGRTFIVAAIATFAIATHPAHLALAGGLIAVLGILRAAAHFVKSISLPRSLLTVPLTSILGAIVLVFAANHALTGQYFISRSGQVFVFARMLQDGLVKPLLDETCPQERYRLCAFKDHLPNRADAFLWDSDSPFNRLQRFHGPMKEYEAIVVASIRRYPLANIAAALRDTAIQFVKIRTGDQIEPQEWVIYSDLAHYLPRQMNAYMSARQQQGELRFGALNVVHVLVAVSSMVVMTLLLVGAARRLDWKIATLPGFVLVALIGNAFICGVFSNPHDRYQSRLVWVPTFVVLLFSTRRVLANLGRIRHLVPDG